MHVLHSHAFLVSLMESIMNVLYYSQISIVEGFCSFIWYNLAVRICCTAENSVYIRYTDEKSVYKCCTL